MMERLRAWQAVCDALFAIVVSLFIVLATLGLLWITYLLDVKGTK